MNWGTCTASCNGGYRSRARSCSSPQPSLGGHLCDGMPSQTEICNTHGCQGLDAVDIVHSYSYFKSWTKENTPLFVTGYYRLMVITVVDEWGAGSWSSWSDCSTSCGSGRRVRTRWCRDQCSDREVETQFQPCSKAECPSPGELTLFVQQLGDCDKQIYIQHRCTDLCIFIFQWMGLGRRGGNGAPVTAIQRHVIASGSVRTRHPPMGARPVLGFLWMSAIVSLQT